MTDPVTVTPSLIIIDDDVAMPNPNARRGEWAAEAERLVLAMKKGQSFAIPFDPNDTGSKAQLRKAERLTYAMKKYCITNNLPYSFSWRTLPDGNIRVWRTA